MPRYISKEVSSSPTATYKLLLWGKKKSVCVNIAELDITPKCAKIELIGIDEYVYLTFQHKLQLHG